MFIQKPIIISFVCMLILNISLLFVQFNQGKYIEISNNNSGYEVFQNIHDRIDGNITLEKTQYIIDEYNKINDIVKDNTYSREYQEDAMTGYYWNDFVVLSKYFYDPLKYMVSYHENIEKIAQKARNNIKFYKEYKNERELSYNKYIEKHYSGRHINLFYDTNLWEHLILENSSELFIILLMILAITINYIMERKQNMSDIILSTENGKLSYGILKVISSVIFVLLNVIIFGLCNYFVFKIFFGLSGESLPLYAIPIFQNTPYSLSVMTFYILKICCQFVAFSVLASFLLLVSKKANTIVQAITVSIIGVMILLFLSGYSVTSTGILQWITTLSPFSLLSIPVISQNLHGIFVFNQFVPYINIVYIVQVILFVLFFIIVCFYKKNKYHWQRSYHV